MVATVGPSITSHAVGKHRRQSSQIWEVQTNVSHVERTQIGQSGCVLLSYGILFPPKIILSVNYLCTNLGIVKQDIIYKISLYVTRVRQKLARTSLLWTAGHCINCRKSRAMSAPEDLLFIRVIILAGENY